MTWLIQSWRERAKLNSVWSPWRAWHHHIWWLATWRSWQKPGRNSQTTKMCDFLLLNGRIIRKSDDTWSPHHGKVVVPVVGVNIYSTNLLGYTEHISRELRLLQLDFAGWTGVKTQVRLRNNAIWLWRPIQPVTPSWCVSKHDIPPTHHYPTLLDPRVYFNRTLHSLPNPAGDCQYRSFFVGPACYSPVKLDIPRFNLWTLPPG